MTKQQQNNNKYIGGRSSLDELKALKELKHLKDIQEKVSGKNLNTSSFFILSITYIFLTRCIVECVPHYFFVYS